MNPAPPADRHWLIACDESGVHAATHYGFGALWMKYQRRGDFVAAFRQIAGKHNFTGECKWTKASGYQAFHQELIDWFFRTRWLVFHCLVVRRDVVRKAEFHNDDWDLARRKHFTMLLTNKMKRAMNRVPDRRHEFTVYVDPIASSYKKADEAVAVISNNVLNQAIKGMSPVKSVITRDSKQTPAIQLCDLLLGAVMETWQQKASNPVKASVRDAVAECLGWTGLDSDTEPEERKFNVWYFFDPPREQRKVRTQKVKLKYPYP